MTKRKIEIFQEDDLVYWLYTNTPICSTPFTYEFFPPADSVKSLRVKEGMHYEGTDDEVMLIGNSWINSKEDFDIKPVGVTGGSENPLDKIAWTVAQIPGISKITISRYALTVHLANKLFSWDDIRLKVIEAVNDALNTEDSS